MKILFSVILAILIGTKIFGQVQPFNNFYNIREVPGMGSFGLHVFTNDSTFVIAGLTGNDFNATTIYISGLDFKGEKLWFNYINELAVQYHFSHETGGIKRIINGTFVFCGAVNSIIPILGNFDSTGSIIWLRNYFATDSSKRILFWAIDEHFDGGFVVVGDIGFGDTIMSVGHRVFRNNGIWIGKFDSLGQLLWDRQYFVTSNYDPINVDAKSILSIQRDSSYIVGIGRSFGTLIGNPFIFKIDNDGNIMWELILGDQKLHRRLFSMIPSLSGDYLFVGCHTSRLEQVGHPNQNNYHLAGEQIFYGKFNDDGDTIWTRKFSFPDGDTIGFNHGIDIKEDLDGNIFILGRKGDSTIKAIVVKADSTGKVLWSRQYWTYDLYTVNNLPFSMDLTNDGGVVFVGEMRSNFYYPPIVDTVGQYTWLVRTDSMGCVTPGCDSNDPTGVQVIPIMPPGSKFRLYPNPATHSATLGLAPGTVADEVRVFDMAGRVVIQLPLQAGSPLTPLPVAALPSGLYLVELRYMGERIGVEKLVLGR